MTRALLVLVAVLAAGCDWIDDEELESRFDSDGDGFPVGSDCNDQRADVTYLTAQLGLVCGDRIDDRIGDEQLLRVSPCPHPMVPDILLHYGRNEDIRALRSEVPVEALVRLETGEGFGMRESTGEEGFVTGGVALFAWEGPICEEEACNVGLPLGTVTQQRGEGGWVSWVTARVLPGEPWYVIVTGDEGSPYTLSVECF